jgi:hypothetical protein
MAGAGSAPPPFSPELLPEAILIDDDPMSNVSGTK